MAHLADTVDPDDYRRKLLLALEAGSDFTAEQAAATRELLEETRRRVLVTILELDPDSRSRPMYERALAQIEEALKRLTERFTTSLASATAGGFDVGIASILGPLENATGIQAGAAGISLERLAIITRIEPDLIQGLTADLRRRINFELRNVMLGSQNPFEAATRIGRNLTDLNHFRTIAHRARAITVTEIGRAQALGQQQAQERLAQDFDDVRKRWISAHLPNARETHLEAEARYRPNGPIGPIPPERTYLVAGFNPMYPRDPILPARESVNCHCVSTTVFGDLDPARSITTEIRKATAPRGAAAPK